MNGAFDYEDSGSKNISSNKINSLNLPNRPQKSLKIKLHDNP